MADFQAKYDFSASAKGMLSFKVGDLFSVVNKPNADWWMVRSASGDLGLAPATYLEPFQDKENASPPKASRYVALYDYNGSDNTQLSIKKGETLFLVDKTDHSWWSMKNEAGEVGFVPVNYLDKLENIQPENKNPESQQNGVKDEKVLQEVLLSIDRAIQKIHEDAAAQDGTYTAEQRSSLQTLVAHRKSVIEDNRDSTAANDTSYAKLTRTKSSSTPDSPSRARRHAPPPPSHSSSAKSSPPNEEKLKKMNRYSLQVDVDSGAIDQRPRFGSLPRRSAPHPPRRRESLGHEQKEVVLSFAKSRASDTKDKSGKKSKDSTLPVSPEKTVKTINIIPPEGASTFYPPSSNTSLGSFQSFSAENVQTQGLHLQRSSSSGSPHIEHRNSSGSPRRLSDNSPGSPRKISGNLPGSPRKTSSNSPGSPRKTSSNSPGSPRKTSSNSPGSPRKLSPGSPKKHSQSKHSQSQNSPQASGMGQASDVSQGPPRIELPTQFPVSDGAELVEVVRARTGVSYSKSLLAVGGVLEFLKNKVPVCSDMVDALLGAVQQSQSMAAAASATPKAEGSQDLERLREIFFEITECKDDSQQRGWAVHDDQQIIMDYLEELLQILCDADPEVTKTAVQEDKYENVLTLITYYQMEARVPIRLLLLKVFGVLCGLDRTVVSVLLTSVLPNELGRDIQDNLTDIQKTLYSSTVCTMIYSTAEAVPLPVYDQWTVEYVLFLLDTIESPPEEDEEDQVPDTFLNVILAFNQHFQDSSSNLVMRALKERSNPRNFSEKLMFLVNRGEDPVAISEPCCPDSLTKFLLDVFADKATSGMFYTTDMMVLIDIVTRQLSDLGPGEETRTHYLELLYRIVDSTNYREHMHRQKDITAVLSRIAMEENVESLRDHKIIQKLWIDFPGCFEEVTDL